MTFDVQPRGLVDRLAVWLATGFGLGYSPKAPGTVGAAAGVALAWVMQPLGLGTQAAVLVGLFLIGVAACNRAIRALGGAEDPQCIVYDEIITVPMTFWGVASFTGYTMDTPWVLLAGFGLHRLFDIWKPPPTRALEAAPPAGWGVMADDCMAGVYSNLALHSLLWCVARMGG